MSYTAEQFIEDVKKEARALKMTATPAELAKLDKKLLDPDSPRDCIYGLMTGHCNSGRASELIFNCCSRYVNKGDWGSLDEALRDVDDAIDGKVCDPQELLERREDNSTIAVDYFSSLEAYILLEEASVDNLIAFLKNETDTLDL